MSGTTPKSRHIGAVTCLASVIFPGILINLNVYSFCRLLLLFFSHFLFVVYIFLVRRETREDGAMEIVKKNNNTFCHIFHRCMALDFVDDNSFFFSHFFFSFSHILRTTLKSSLPEFPASSPAQPQQLKGVGTKTRIQENKQRQQKNDSIKLYTVARSDE